MRSLLLLFPFAAALACAPEPRPADVLIVTLDAVRADITPGFGGDAKLAPNLARWVQAGTHFERAYTTAPLTMPAHSTIFTGLYPAHHGARRHGDGAHMAESLPLVQAAGTAGYATAAFVSTKLFSFGRGGLSAFQVADAPVETHERSAAKTVGRARAWLDRQPAAMPVFVWVHLFEAHAPYVPSRVRWQRCPEGVRADAVAWARQTPIGCSDPPDAERWPVNDALPCVRELYESQLREMDGPIGELVRAMAARGRFRWVLAADHGECLGEEGHVAQHGGTLLECAVHIPLVIGGIPAFKAVQARHDLVSLADVAPTVAAMMGWSLPAADGIDLASRQRRADEGVAFEAAGMGLPACHGSFQGAWRGDEKVVYAPEMQTTRAWRRTGAGVVEIEPQALSAGAQTLARELAWEPPLMAPPGDLDSPKGNDAATETLRALGYVQ